MNNLRLTTCALLTSLLVLGADRNWSTGKVLDTAASRTITASGVTSTGHTDAYGTAYTTGNINNNSFGNSSVGSVTTANGSSNSYGATRFHHQIMQDEQIVIQGSGYVYIASDIALKSAGSGLHGSLGRAIANRKHGCRTVVGDPIQYAQVKNNLYIVDADGKECKLDIVRQERITANAGLPR